MVKILIFFQSYWLFLLFLVIYSPGNKFQYNWYSLASDVCYHLPIDSFLYYWQLTRAWKWHWSPHKTKSIASTNQEKNHCLNQSIITSNDIKSIGICKSIHSFQSFHSFPTPHKYLPREAQAPHDSYWKIKKLHTTPSPQVDKTNNFFTNDDNEIGSNPPSGLLYQHIKKSTTRSYNKTNEAQSFQEGGHFTQSLWGLFSSQSMLQFEGRGWHWNCTCLHILQDFTIQNAVPKRCVFFAELKDIEQNQIVLDWVWYMIHETFKFNQ